MQLLRVLTGDDRFTPDTNSIKSKGKSVTMCEVLDKVENRGKLKLLSDLIKDGILSLQQAAEKMGMTESKFKTALKELEVYNHV